MAARDCTQKNTEVNHCHECGLPFRGRPNKKYCSAVCRNKAKQRRRYKRAKSVGKTRRPIGRSNCNECGKSFVVYAGTAGKFCSRSCNAKHQVRKREANPSIAEARREARLLRRIGEFSSVRSATCVQCGSGFIARDESVFCSYECSSSHRKDHGKFYSRWNDGLCITEIRVCPVSGHLFKPEHMGQTLSNEGRRMRRAAEKARAKALRRSRKKGGDLIVPQEVFEKADYKCAICGCQTDPDKRGTYEDDAPELDHIIPLARGGTHTIDNVQCACRSCNNSKRDTLPHDGDQARLIA